MSGANHFGLDTALNPYSHPGPVDLKRAKLDHQNIAQCFRQAGVDLLSVKPPRAAQDGVFVANWAVCHGDKAVLARLPKPRAIEEKTAEICLWDLELEVVKVPEDWHFSGSGDALVCGKYLLAGHGYRSDPRACAFAANELGLELVLLKTVPALDGQGKPVINQATGWPDSYFYDLDLALGVLNHDLIVYCPEAFDEASRQIIESLPLETIKVDSGEAVNGFACNLVSTGQTVIMSAEAPKLQAEIECRGFTVLTPDVQELKRAGGFIHCVSLDLGL